MKFKTFLVSGVLSLAALPAFAAGSWSSVTVTEILPYTTEGVAGGPLLQVSFSANSTGGPGCATNKSFANVDLSTVSGAFAGAVLQSARLSGSTISVVGTGTCGLFSVAGTIENVAYVEE